MMFALPSSLPSLGSDDNFDSDAPAVPTYDQDLNDPPQEMTQSQTQPVDYAPPVTERFEHLWGRLVPASPKVKRIDFNRSKDRYSIGRAQNADYQLSGSNRISGIHVWFHYADNTVFMTDRSMNGTFVNGRRVAKGVSLMIHDRDEISMGPPADQDIFDYRFIFKCGNDPDPLVGGGVHDKYQVGEKIGSGAFATVCKAVKLSTSELVAVKIILKSRFTKDRERNLLMFEREKKIVSRLEHPGIVNYLDYFEDEMSIFLVMELVLGGDLMDYINDRNQAHTPIEENEVQRLTREMCGALAYLHQQGVVHRDLKPENVLLTKDDPPKAKIADFGLSKAIDSQTFLKTMCGTPAYLAPEVVLNQGGYTALVDSWSLGVIVFATLSATMPFASHEDQDLITSLRTREVFWEYLPDHVSPLGKHWISLMINRDTNVRMNMILALQHEWLRNEEYELEQSYSQEPYSQTYPDEAADIRNPLSASSSSACISVDTRDVTPETPLQHPIGLDDCSQDLGNLRLSSEDMKSQWSLDTESVNICHGAADYFPSIPRMTPRIPYPPHPSKESDNNLTGMNPLRSAWMPRPSGGPLAPVSEDSDILTPGGKRKLRSSPPRAPSPVSEKSSSPLSSPPPLSEGTVRPEAGKKPASRQSPPERRTSIRIKARKSKAVASAAAEQTPPPVPISKVKRRRLTSTGNAARYSSPSTRARQRSSSAETTKSNPMRRARRS